mgnify:CR=1 FL=1
MFMYWKSGERLSDRSILHCLSVFLANFLWYIASFFWYSYILTLMQCTSISLLVAPFFYWIYILLILNFWFFWFKGFDIIWAGAKLIRLKKLDGLEQGVELPEQQASFFCRSHSLFGVWELRRLDRSENGLMSLVLKVAGAGELLWTAGWSLGPWMNWHLEPYGQ